jgi:hypothetical protein
MNNRKTKNKRGARSREEWLQLAPEPEKIRMAVGEGEEKQVLELLNPRYGRMRRIVHKNFNREI